jgi:hypothetical protein
MRSTYRNPQNLHIDSDWLKSELAEISTYARPVMAVDLTNLAFSIVNNIDLYGNQKLIPLISHEVVPGVWRRQAAQMGNREFGFYPGGIELRQSGLFDSKARIYPYLLIYNQTRSTWTVDFGPNTAQEVGRFDGKMVVIQEIGKQGILVLLGGNQAKSISTSDQRKMLYFQSVHIYDVFNQRWFRQVTSGLENMLSPRIDFCAVAVTVSIS